MRPAPIFWGVPLVNEATALLPVRQRHSLWMWQCDVCTVIESAPSESKGDPSLLRGDADGELYERWVWCSSGGDRRLCDRCYDRVTEAIEEATRANKSLDVASLLLLISRVSFLRDLAFRALWKWYGGDCGWCQRRTPHTECLARIIRLASTVAVEQSRAVFIGGLPLPADVQGVVRVYSVATCDVRAALRGLADALLSPVSLGRRDTTAFCGCPHEDRN